jgi:hypothetical protein
MTDEIFPGFTEQYFYRRPWRKKIPGIAFQSQNKAKAPFAEERRWRK